MLVPFFSTLRQYLYKNTGLYINHSRVLLAKFIRLTFSKHN